MPTYSEHKNSLIREILQAVENYGRRHNAVLNRDELFQLSQELPVTVAELMGFGLDWWPDS